MAEHLLHGTEIGSALEQVRGEGVPQEVWVHSLGFEARLLGELAQDHERTCAGQRTASCVEKEIGPMSLIEVRSAEREVPANGFGCRATQGNDPLLVALPEHAHDACIDVHRRAGEPYGLGDPETGAVHQFDKRAIAKCPRRRAVRSLDQTL